MILSSTVITAPDYLPDRKAAILFLGGPIREAPLWRREAIKIIQDMDKTLCIASPQRPGSTEEIFEGEKEQEQTTWETFYLRRARERGVALFWFPKKPALIRNSGLELGVALGSKGHMVVGIEPGFPETYIRDTIRVLSPDVKICTKLEDTCSVAVQLMELIR